MTMTTDNPVRNEGKALLRRWYDRSPISRQSVRRLHRLLEPSAKRRGLCVLATEVLVSQQLVEQGGTWSWVSIQETPAPAARTLAGPGLKRLSEGRLPFPDSAFDVVLMDQVLEYVQDDRALVAECHRVLKPDGRMVLSAGATKRWSLIRLLRALGRADPQASGRVRAGYTESGLFDVLKDGFDAEEAAVWSRFFSELADLLVRGLVSIAGGASGTGQPGDDDRWILQARRSVRLHGLLYPVARLLSALDVLVFFTRGYRLAFRARRRAWRPRRTPSLRDGRSIAEAAINTKIGTAAPF